MRGPCEPLIPLNGCKIKNFPVNYQIFPQKSFVSASFWSILTKTACKSLHFIRGILRGIGTGIDHVAVLHQGIENVAEHNDARCCEEDVRPYFMGKDCGKDNATQTEEHDEMTANDKRVLIGQHRALGLCRPPVTRLLSCWHVGNRPPYMKIGAVEGEGDIGSMNEEDDECPVCQNRPISHEADGENAQIADHDLSRHVVGPHQ